MSELTIVSCPTCGLPAELITRLDEATEAGRPDIVIRCLDDHVSTIPLTPATAQLKVELARLVLPADGSEEAAEVLPIRPRRGPIRALGDGFRWMIRSIQGMSQGWVRALWFCYGAAAAALFIRQPLAALVVLPLTIPVIGLARARRSWREFATVTFPARPEPAGDEDDEEKAA